MYFLFADVSRYEPLDWSKLPDRVLILTESHQCSTRAEFRVVDPSCEKQKLRKPIVMVNLLIPKRFLGLRLFFCYTPKAFFSSVFDFWDPFPFAFVSGGAETDPQSRPWRVVPNLIGVHARDRPHRHRLLLHVSSIRSPKRTFYCISWTICFVQCFWNF